MSQGRRIAAALSIAAALTVAAASSAPALDVSSTTTTVTTPGATVPSASTPVATTPTVTVPKTTTTVTTPPVSTTKPPASKPAPSPSTGALPVKAPKAPKGAPAVSTPKDSLPSVGTGSGSGGGSTGSGGGSTGSRGGGDGGGSSGGLVDGLAKSLPGLEPSGTAGMPAGGGYSAPASGNPAAAPIVGGMPGGPGAGGGTGSFGPSPFGIFRGTGGTSGGVDAFTAAVASLAGCFYALTPFEQQVLIVRTGIDGRQPLTRSQLAALMGTSPAAIRRTERGALTRLRSAARGDGCMPVAPGTPASAGTAFVAGPFGPVGFVTPAVAPTSRTVPGATPNEPPPRLSGTSFADRVPSLGGGGRAGPLWAALVIALLLATALAALGRELRRSVY